MFVQRLSIVIVLSAMLFAGCSGNHANDSTASAPVNKSVPASANAQTPDSLMPEPVDDFVHEESDEDHEQKELWIEQTHRSSPDTDWREINNKNAELLASLRPAVNARMGSESFANGQLTGTWSDRGPNNQAGSMDKICYLPQTDTIYGISGELSSSGVIGGRSLWKGNRNGTSWTILNDDYFLRSDALEALIPSGGSSVRLIGTEQKFIYHSEDEGATWQACTMTPDPAYAGFGRRMRLEHLPGDNDTVFYLLRTWDANPWEYRIWLYRSTDAGLTFDRVQIFDEDNRKAMDMWVPANGTTAYVLENSTALHSFTSTGSSSVTCNGLPTTASEYQLTGSLAGGSLTLYALIGGEDVYKSTNGGANWNFVSTSPINAWDVGMQCSPDDEDVLVLGGQDCYRSYDGGNSWTEVNDWTEYYSNIDKLHADMMEIAFCETSTGTPFILIGNHGGMHISYDNMLTTTNIGKAGLNVGQVYDVLTHPTNTDLVFIGTQDQGFQFTSDADAPGPWDADQLISGDFGQLHLTRNNQSFWQQYPGGWFFYYHNASSPVSRDDTFNVDGSDMAYWIVPTGKIRSNPGGNSILVGGGDLSGGAGSHLIKLTADTSSPHDISGTQYGYDFTANSTSGNGLISAIEQPAHDADTIYVTTNDGSFFKTTNDGASWQKTAGFQVAPTNWVYTSTILNSKLDPNLIWTSGSGYNNPPVYKSTDGGNSFVDMSNGLPDTLVQEIVANPDETLLFAATDNGPYVYSVADDQWYSMLGAITPLNWFASVEYVEALDTVRFATMARGVWDFKISATGTFPTEFIDVTKGVWTGGQVTDLEDSDNIDVSIQRDPFAIQARVEMIAEFTSPTASPGVVTCIQESSVFARTTVLQTVEMFNFTSGSYESIDSRNARRFTDQVVEVNLPGDVSRFVEPGTDLMRARIRYTSLSPRQAFSANIDRLVWEFN